MMLHSQVELNDEGVDTAKPPNEFIIMDIFQSNHANKQILTFEECHHIERLLKGFGLRTQILFDNKLEE